MKRRLRSARARGRGRRDDQVEVVDVDGDVYKRLVGEGIVNARGEVVDERLLREVLEGGAVDVVDVEGEVVGGAGDVGAPPAGFYSGELDGERKPGGADDPLGVEKFFTPAGAMPSQAKDPTIRWGDSLVLSFDPLGQTTASGQFLQTKLHAPSACTLSIHIEQEGDPGVVSWSSLTLFVGVGSSRLRREIAFGNLPAVGAPVDFVLDLLAVHELAAIGGAKAVTEFGGTITLVKFEVQIAPVEQNR